MIKIFKLLVIGIVAFAVVVGLFERYILTKWYSFKLEHIEIEVKSDACETCFMDWPINHTFWIQTEDGMKGEFELYTEGPRLEFGLNAEKNRVAH